MSREWHLHSWESPEKIHAFLLTYNWDMGEEIPRLLVTNPACDRGTALRCYWVAGAGYFQRYKDRSSVPQFELKGFDFVAFVESRLLENQYFHNSILFNPFWDRDYMDPSGYNWVACYPEMPGGRQIPQVLRWPNSPDSDWDALGRPGLRNPSG